MNSSVEGTKCRPVQDPYARSTQQIKKKNQTKKNKQIMIVNHSITTINHTSTVHPYTHTHNTHKKKIHYSTTLLQYFHPPNFKDEYTTATETERDVSILSVCSDNENSIQITVSNLDSDEESTTIPITLAFSSDDEEEPSTHKVCSNQPKGFKSCLCRLTRKKDPKLKRKPASHLNSDWQYFWMVINVRCKPKRKYFMG